jgi:hypothetical protein
MMVRALPGAFSRTTRLAAFGASWSEDFDPISTTTEGEEVCNAARAPCGAEA